MFFRFDVIINIFKYYIEQKDFILIKLKNRRYRRNLINSLKFNTNKKKKNLKFRHRRFILNNNIIF